MIFKLTLYFSIIFSVLYLGNPPLFAKEDQLLEIVKFNFKDTKLNTKLTNEEFQQLLEKKRLRFLKDIPNHSWPEITYFVVLKSSPLESAGLFAAYDIQKNYIPNLIESTPVKHVTSTDVWTRYELRLPFPLKNAKYIHGARLTKHADRFEVAWYLVESTTTKALEGEAAFYRLNESETLMVYRTLVTPKSFMASWVKSSMLSDVELTIDAITKFIETSSKNDRKLTSKYSEFITRMLQDQKVYEISQD